MNLRCGKCMKTIMIPDQPTRSVDCPHCKKPVAIVNEETKAWHMGKGVRPAWKKSWGKGLLAIAFGIVVVTVIYKSNMPESGTGLGAGETIAMNPFFWIALCLGLFWANTGGPGSD